MSELTPEGLAKLCGNMPPPGTLKADAHPSWTERSQDQQDIHEAILNTIFPPYADRIRQLKLAPRPLGEGEKVEWDSLVDQNMAGSWVGQRTGSCVGTNAFNVILCQIAVENLIQKTGELLDPDYFWGVPYGYGRYFGGMHSEGEGSYLSVQCKAFLEIGIPRCDASRDFPQYEPGNGARWISSKQEYFWSSRRNFGSKYDDAADDHLLLDGAMASTLDELRTAIMYGPIGMAGMLGSNRVYTKDGVKMSDWSADWSHNMGLCGRWNHPNLGPIWKVLNRSWTPSEYSWFWITERTLEEVVRDRATEFMIVRNFDGMEGAGLDLEWLIQFIMSL